MSTASSWLLLSFSCSEGMLVYVKFGNRSWGILNHNPSRPSEKCMWTPSGLMYAKNWQIAHSCSRSQKDVLLSSLFPGSSSVNLFLSILTQQGAGQTHNVFSKKNLIVRHLCAQIKPHSLLHASAILYSHTESKYHYRWLKEVCYKSRAFPKATSDFFSPYKDTEVLLMRFNEHSCPL